MNPHSLCGEHVLITGASGLVGRSAMQHFAEKGVKTTAVSRRKPVHTYGADWRSVDLADPQDRLDLEFDLVVLAGNVMIFLEPGTEPRVLRQLVDRLVPGGLLVAGFQLRPGRLALTDYDDMCASVGLKAVARWATWAWSAMSTRPAAR